MMMILSIHPLLRRARFNVPARGVIRGKQNVKTTKRKAATVAAKKICQSSKNVPKGKYLRSSTPPSDAHLDSFAN